MLKWIPKYINSDINDDSLVPSPHPGARLSAALPHLGSQSSGLHGFRIGIYFAILHFPGLCHPIIILLPVYQDLPKRQHIIPLMVYPIVSKDVVNERNQLIEEKKAKRKAAKENQEEPEEPHIYIYIYIEL